jgi:hypothetical protein
MSSGHQTGVRLLMAAPEPNLTACDIVRAWVRHGCIGLAHEGITRDGTHGPRDAASGVERWPVRDCADPKGGEL